MKISTNIREKVIKYFLAPSYIGVREEEKGNNKIFYLATVTIFSLIVIFWPTLLIKNIAGEMSESDQKVQISSYNTNKY